MSYVDGGSKLLQVLQVDIVIQSTVTRAMDIIDIQPVLITWGNEVENPKT